MCSVVYQKVESCIIAGMEKLIVEQLEGHKAGEVSRFFHCKMIKLMMNMDFSTRTC